MIYLDNAATSPVRPQVQAVIQDSLAQLYGNPSSTYQVGRQAKARLIEAREQVADLLGVEAKEVYFTSGASEANNWALKNIAYQASQAGEVCHLVATAIEHPSVAQVLQFLEDQGCLLDYVYPDDQGRIQVQDFLDLTGPDTKAWVAMAVNNEVGSVLPYQELGAKARELGIAYHLDAVQAISSQRQNLMSADYTSLTLSAHKLGGPKGIGLLVYRGDTPLEPLIHGGGQEAGQRSGTENLPYILGLAQALALVAEEEAAQAGHHRQLSDQLYQGLDQAGIAYTRNGGAGPLTDSIHSLWLQDLASSQVLIQLDLAGIEVSAGSACSAGSLQPSQILQAYYPDQAPRWSQTIRVSFGPQTETSDIVQLIKELAKISERKR